MSNEVVASSATSDEQQQSLSTPAQSTSVQESEFTGHVAC